MRYAPKDRHARGAKKRRSAMKKISTVQRKLSRFLDPEWDLAIFLITNLYMDQKQA
jgi:hypothetical protein